LRTRRPSALYSSPPSERSYRPIYLSHFLCDPVHLHIIELHGVVMSVNKVIVFLMERVSHRVSNMALSRATYLRPPRLDLGLLDFPSLVCLPIGLPSPVLIHAPYRHIFSTPLSIQNLKWPSRRNWFLDVLCLGAKRRDKQIVHLN
jgi:hypothetical protein